MRAYSDHGHAFRAWENPNDLLPGEVYFDREPTLVELRGAFAGYDAWAPPGEQQPTLAELQAKVAALTSQIAAMIAQG